MDSPVYDVLLLGAAGSSGQLVARELAARGLSIRLAGRRPEPLAGLVSELSASGTAAASVVAGSGRRLAAQAQVGDGVEAGAAFAAEVARRVLAATRAAPGDDRRRRDAHRAGRHPRRPPCPVARRQDHRAGQSRSSARLTDGTSRRVLAVLALLRIGTADRDAI